MPFSQQASARPPFVTCTLAKRNRTRHACGGAERTRSGGGAVFWPASLRQIRSERGMRRVPAKSQEPSVPNGGGVWAQGADLLQRWKMRSLKLPNNLLLQQALRHFFCLTPERFRPHNTHYIHGSDALTSYSRSCDCMNR